MFTLGKHLRDLDVNYLYVLQMIYMYYIDYYSRPIFQQFSLFDYLISSKYFFILFLNCLTR